MQRLPVGGTKTVYGQSKASVEGAKADGGQQSYCIENILDLKLQLLGPNRSVQANFFQMWNIWLMN